MIRNLVYDVGMNNGDDTAYYLHLGYNVVAIEANEFLVEKAKARFQPAISENRLKIIHAGIGPEEGIFDFWVNEENDGHSSFLKEVAGRNNSKCHVVKTRCIQFDRVLMEHRVPYYLKIDIEKHDVHCLQGLEASDLPEYVSIEAHSLDYLVILAGLGYRSFKLVDQSCHNFPHRIFQNDTLSGYFLGTCVRGFRRVKYRFLDGKYRTGDYCFPRGTSGPFGEETPGEWHPLEDVAYDWLNYSRGHHRRGTHNKWGWYDFHAKK
ncbi:MAG: FkbM family methyltransferase [Deltaproteobacteria bacterium]|nr:MAG: FkbM family methyltransferase [Deltaproteobacteria bacterium]